MKVQLIKKLWRKEAGIPAIEAFMRYADMYCKWALWNLGEGERFVFEIPTETTTA